MAAELYFTVPEEYDNSRAREFLRRYCGVSARLLTRLTRTENGILMDGSLLRTVDYVKAGSVVELAAEREQSFIEPTPGKLDVVFEDEYILAVSKPAFMPVHPVKKHRTDTLANIVAHYCGAKGETYVFRAVNRLDKDTSGIVIIAKNRFCASKLKTSVKKVYYALCGGSLSGEGTIDEPIGLSESSGAARCVRADGAKAVTHYRSVLCSEKASLLELTLETGRTHQIRCHLAYLGNPLLGDELYGGSRELISRQALHCARAEFVHPVTNNMIKVSSDIPEDMRRAAGLLFGRDFDKALIE